MDLLKKIEELKHRIDKFEQLTEDLNENILSKQKKIDYLKNRSQELSYPPVKNILKKLSALLKKKKCPQLLSVKLLKIV